MQIGAEKKEHFFSSFVENEMATGITTVPRILLSGTYERNSDGNHRFIDGNLRLAKERISPFNSSIRRNCS